MRRLLVVMVLILSNMAGWANNIKINSEAKVTGFIGSAQDTAIVEFNLSWDNSWRDDFNWDAAWIFLKYKKRGATQEWHHAYLAKEGHTASAVSGNEGGNYTFMFGEVGSGNAAKVTGVYLMRDGIAEGKVNTKVQIKWPIRSNSKLSLSENDFGLNRDSIYIAAYAVEMVYVPYGSYTLGDGFSNKSYSFNGIPADADVIDLNSNYTITAAHVYKNFYATNVANRVDNPLYGTSASWEAYSTPPYWWQIDFKTQKTIRYFGVSGATTHPTLAPQGTWYLQGSNDGLTWTNLAAPDKNQWSVTPVSYPVQNKIKVSSPGAYQYYRIYMPQVHTDLVVQNIAMTEANLGEIVSGVLIDSEQQKSVVVNGQKLTWPSQYPKGYRGYYLMKYEVSQEQYVEFLNSLVLAQQKNRVANNNFDKMVKGDYVFGDLKRPNCRNGIAFIMTKGTGTSAVFGNNLNPGNKFYSEDDGQTLACNYLSPADMLAYCDWSGLRPMSELEYEKACRRPSPQIPDKGEFAWNSNTGINKLRALSDLTGEKTEREAPFDYKVNVNSGAKINGPLRSGAFATNRTSQLEAGATYWGIMEMSGNLWEMSYNAETAGALFKADDPTYSHGDGYLTDAGTDIAAAYWPNVVGAVAVRGGSFVSADSLLRTSDRTWAVGNYFSTFTQRDSTVGFRGARSILNSSGFTAGKIYFQNGTDTDTVCSGEGFVILGEPAEKTIGKTTYSWYVSEDNSVSWRIIDGENNMTFQYNGLANLTAAYKTVMFKRKAVCAVGEESTGNITVRIVPDVKKPELKSYNILAGLGHKLVLPAPLDASFDSRWKYPSGAEQDGKNAVVNNFVASDNGIYKLWNIDKNGCPSEKIDVNISGIDGVPIINYGDYNAWADGNYAASANAYRNPEAPYKYEGATGDGLYRILPEGSSTPLNAYCDMTTDGGGWTLVWKAAVNNYNTTSYSYEVGSLSNWNFSEVGMAYVNIKTMLRSNFTIISASQVVSDFKVQHPFLYGARDVTVTAKYGSYQQANVNFRFGSQNFPSYVYDAWHGTGTLYGRIGINWSQSSPYYSGFTSPNGDYCVVGQQAYSSQGCSDARRFSFWVR